MADDMQEGEDENTFNQEEFDKIVSDTAEEVLKEAMWDEMKVPHWINQICEQITEKLVKMQRPYKFVVTCLLMQKAGANCHSSISLQWETPVDGVVAFIYPSTTRAKDAQNKTIQCLVQVFCTKF